MFDISMEQPFGGYCDEFIPFLRSQSPELERIYNNIQAEQFFPSKQNVLRAMAVPPGNIKAVLVGMDPYATATEVTQGVFIPEATGRSFEVASVTSWQHKFRQSSLRNILKAVYNECTGNDKSIEQIRKDILDRTFDIPEPRVFFDCLERNGVMCLNAALTVREGCPGSHSALWKGFTTRLVQHINESSPDAEWLLFGNNAQKAFLDLIDSRHAKLTRHPRLAGFVNDKPFERIHDILSTICCTD